MPGAGDDVVRSTSGYDRLDGGDGDDRLILARTGGAVTGGAGHDTLAVNASLATEDVIFNGPQGHAMIGRDPSDGPSMSFFRISSALSCYRQWEMTSSTAVRATMSSSPATGRTRSRRRCLRP